MEYLHAFQPPCLRGSVQLPPVAQRRSGEDRRPFAPSRPATRRGDPYRPCCLAVLMRSQKHLRPCKHEACLTPDIKNHRILGFRDELRLEVKNMIFNPAHPGEVSKDYLGDITVAEASRRLGVTRAHLSRILNGRAGISASMSLRLSATRRKR